MTPRRSAALFALVLLVASCGDDDAQRSSATTAASEATDTTSVQSSTTEAAPIDAGEVLEAERVDDPGPAAEAWRVRYRSVSVEGRPVEVSGMVARPAAPPPAGGYPVLAWAHGTTGVADDCAPSRWGSAILTTVQPFLDAGFVVAATDYEGLGTPGVHPYLVSVSEGRSVLDSVRAARHVIDGTSQQVVVMGHSQGGHAALATAEIADDWSPELELAGTISIAPAGDLVDIVPIGLLHADAFGFGALVVAGWSDAYSDLDATDVLTDAGLEIVEIAEQRCVGEVFDAVDGRPIDTFVRRPPSEIPEWRRRTEDNTIHPDEVTGPVLLVQGAEDFLIPSRLTEALASDLCDAGVAVRYAAYPGEGHGSVVIAAGADMVTWAEDRLAGETPVPTC